MWIVNAELLVNTKYRKSNYKLIKDHPIIVTWAQYLERREHNWNETCMLLDTIWHVVVENNNLIDQ